MSDKIVFDRVTQVFELSGKPFTAVTELNLTIADNEFVTVVGPSGCGKSTIMNQAAGLLKPTGGQVRVDGKPVTGPGPERGVIFQQYALFPWLTVRKNVEFGLELQKIPKSKRRQIADRQLELTGLTQFADALPKNLSGGMKQRCAIARAYAANPSILLMDEPFGALDALTRVHMQTALLDTWQQEKRTVMFITHDVDEAVFLANRVIVMAARPGRIHQIIDVDLPYPRNDDLRTSPEFTDLRNQVWNAVYKQ
ncbi:MULTISPECIES: ABC transporter ATP-binding protein [unclassified Tessaracoccus]|uniref:ABC transporter ATP-binding protein n=1 Tax=unclassified Tessaracoccus TaxID=2635419 RepID=UPI00096C94D2|nr:MULTISPECIES: ABC transporter ATP-binding protein [unclassified Tessaracoccus]MBB1509709.1 ABC transporter ATP-binding protein [Tessaracoccus sp. MC1756]MCG6566989.1 ABC transporter ATP-binding protein [Tessaracoccus sp. ZS01]OMG58111.1 ATP-binding protein [Tessaracoccus sp. ZS01]